MGVETTPGLLGTRRPRRSAALAATGPLSPPYTLPRGRAALLPFCVPTRNFPRSLSSAPRAQLREKKHRPASELLRVASDRRSKRLSRVAAKPVVILLVESLAFNLFKKKKKGNICGAQQAGRNKTRYAHDRRFCHFEILGIGLVAENLMDFAFASNACKRQLLATSGHCPQFLTPRPGVPEAWSLPRWRSAAAP